MRKLCLALPLLSFPAMAGDLSGELKCQDVYAHAVEHGRDATLTKEISLADHLVAIIDDGAIDVLTDPEVSTFMMDAPIYRLDCETNKMGRRCASASGTQIFHVKPDGTYSYIWTSAGHRGPQTSKTHIRTGMCKPNQD